MLVRFPMIFSVIFFLTSFFFRQDFSLLEGWGVNIVIIDTDVVHMPPIITHSTPSESLVKMDLGNETCENVPYVCESIPSVLPESIPSVLPESIPSAHSESETLRSSSPKSLPHIFLDDVSDTCSIFEDYVILEAQNDMLHIILQEIRNEGYRNFSLKEIRTFIPPCNHNFYITNESRLLETDLTTCLNIQVDYNLREILVFLKTNIKATEILRSTDTSSNNPQFIELYKNIYKLNSQVVRTNFPLEV